jgi:hypothetical protein
LERLEKEGDDPVKDNVDDEPVKVDDKEDLEKKLKDSGMSEERAKKIVEKFKVMKFSKPKPIVDVVDSD